MYQVYTKARCPATTVDSEKYRRVFSYNHMKEARENRVREAEKVVPFSAAFQKPWKKWRFAVLWLFCRFQIKETRENYVREAEKVMPSGTFDTKTVEREVPRRVVAVL